MRRDEAFLLGAMTGAVVVWLWGAKLENRLETRRVRTKAADAIQAVEVTVRPAM
jgi:hypothetical protein